MTEAVTSSTKIKIIISATPATIARYSYCLLVLRSTPTRQPPSTRQNETTASFVVVVAPRTCLPYPQRQCFGRLLGCFFAGANLMVEFEDKYTKSSSSTRLWLHIIMSTTALVTSTTSFLALSSWKIVLANISVLLNSRLHFLKSVNFWNLFKNK